MVAVAVAVVVVVADVAVLLSTQLHRRHACDVVVVAVHGAAACVVAEFARVRLCERCCRGVVGC